VAFERDCVCPSKARRKGTGEPRTIRGLVNARLLALEFDTFEAPPDAAIKRLKPGDFVKVARNGERFWVRVDGYVGRKWHGTVSNKLILSHDLKLGDSIFFMRKNIYDLRYADPKRIPAQRRGVQKFAGVKVWGE
jgi:hypothetical protein